jgi:hypothetical protein
MPPGMTYFPVASTTLDRFGAWKQAKSVVGGLPAGIYVLLSYYTTLHVERQEGGDHSKVHTFMFAATLSIRPSLTSTSATY